MIIRHHKEKQYDVITNNAVGPTTSTTVRTVTSHNDTNSVYLASNGTSGGTGTSSDPVDTLDNAIALLGGGKTIITVIRNGYVGEIVFTAPYSDIPANTTIQVELGETALIRRSVVAPSQLTSQGAKNYTCGAFGNNRFVVGASGDYIYHSTDAFNWTQDTSIGGVKNWWGMCFGNNRFLAITSSSDQIYYSNDGITWNTTSSLTKTWGCVIYANALYLAGAYSDTIYYSSDGVNWTAGTAPTGDWNCLGYGDGYYLAGKKNGSIYKSTDGINWTQTSSPITQWNAMAYGQGRWIAVSSGFNSGVYYSYDGQNWTRYTDPLLNNTFETIFFSGYRWFLGGYYNNSTQLATSTDAENWNSYFYLITTQAFFQGNGMIIQCANQDHLGTLSEYLYHWYDTVLPLYHDNISLNGLYLDGYNLHKYGVSSNDSSGISLSWCDYQGNLRSNIFNMDNPNITECKMGGSDSYGLEKCENPSINECIFYNIEGTAIDQTGNTVDIDQCTFHNCNYGIVLNDQITTTTALKNLIFSDCAYDIRSLITELTVANSVINGLLEKITIASSCLKNVKVLYHDEENNDYKLRHEFEDYSTDSPGYDLSDNTGHDSGAWDVTANLIDIVWDETTFNDKQFNVDYVGLEPIEPNSAHNLLSDYQRNYNDFVRIYEITARDIATMDKYWNMEQILRTNNICHAFPMDYGVGPLISPTPFVWLDKFSVDGLVKVTMTNSSEIASVKTYFDDNSPVGWFAWVGSISGASSPYITYPFKIVNYEDKESSLIFYLENFHGLYPGTGFASDPDGNYIFRFSKGIGNFILGYKGLVNGLYEFDFLSTNSSGRQLWEINQWKDYWFCTTYSDGIGSRRYFRIISNTESKIYADDPLGNIAQVNSHNNACIDLAMMKVDLRSISGDSQSTNTDHGKHGNDYFSTKITREEIGNLEGYRLYNRTGQSLRLITLNNEYDEDIDL